MPRASSRPLGPLGLFGLMGASSLPVVPFLPVLPLVPGASCRPADPADLLGPLGPLESLGPLGPVAASAFSPAASCRSVPGGDADCVGVGRGVPAAGFALVIAPGRPGAAAAAVQVGRFGDTGAGPAAGDVDGAALRGVRPLPVLQCLVRRVVHERAVQLHNGVRTLRNVVQDPAEPRHREERQLASTYAMDSLRLVVRDPGAGQTVQGDTDGDGDAQRDALQDAEEHHAAGGDRVDQQPHGGGSPCGCGSTTPS